MRVLCQNLLYRELAVYPHFNIMLCVCVSRSHRLSISNKEALDDKQFLLHTGYQTVSMELL